MRLHEYQAKDQFADAGIPVPDGRLAETPAAAREAAESIGGRVAVKAQVHVGGRGKAGGIEVVDDPAAAEDAAETILGMDLKGHHVESVLVEAAVDFTNELYVGVTMDRSRKRPVIMVSTRGGVDIEAVAAEEPDAIAREHVDPHLGVYPYQARRVVERAGVDPAVAGEVASVVATLYDLWADSDASEVEINPLMVTESGVVAADAVFNVEDDALFRQDALAALDTEESDDSLESQADAAGLDYVRLEGSVGIIGNGAGLVMATLDLVDHFGGAPANFLDIGGGADAERVRAALELLFADDNVEAVVFNVFGGITRGDEVAQGIVDALDALGEVPKPVVVRLAGTNASEGMAILGDRVETQSTLEDAVRRGVEFAEGSA
ncbi:ADP-forming succinate--CoA ligase subunit beta [Halococcoides cellulosivorans]|uniref:Succinate--CoA ligase [ADP-forming] subunit beta n=1 Tax=Halococcoides cellulosivorans TaxID=1679096 RepID=A0A2R4WXF4_9EURY|nr:ADP-forming succinate--CoA ligase subunit beta [Halococcoides cellulosivorans]AWB26218.1 ADP-forming succinate--CoA ligase subunit beta [Halococcoides cellulosivorans]